MTPSQPHVWVLERHPPLGLPTVKKYHFLRQGDKGGVVVLSRGARVFLRDTPRRAFFYSREEMIAALRGEYELTAAQLEQHDADLQAAKTDLDSGFPRVDDVPALVPARAKPRKPKPARK